MQISHGITRFVGSVWAFVTGLVAAIIWLVVGVVSGFPLSWELVGSVGLPFLALLTLFVVQHTQNHNDRALHLKIDELLRALSPANDALVAIEDANERELEHLRDRYRSEVRSPALDEATLADDETDPV